MKSFYKTILITFLISFLGINGYAQDYKAAELWDAPAGIVKQIKYKSQDPLLTYKNLKFDQNGKLKNSMIVYDSTGYPDGIDINFGPISLSAKFQFNNNDLVIAELIRKKPDPFELKVEYEFANGEMVKESAICKSKNKTVTYDYIFSDYKLDKNGNWISRAVDLTIKDGFDIKTKRYSEQRDIKYWGINK